MKKWMSTVLLFCLVSCSSQEKQVEETKKVDNIIGLREAISTCREMKLSEVADSIFYVPLETASKTVLRQVEDGIFTYNSPFFTYFGGNVFDWNGRFVRKIGKMGQGPGEETNPWGYSIFYDKARRLFYTKGDKLIQFDEKGKFTGKEVRLTYREASGNATQGWKNTYAFVKGGSNYVLANYPDSLFWLDTDLNVLQGKRVLPDSLYLGTGGSSAGLVYPSFSVYQDTTLFYNCFTDTVYSILSDRLQPRWIIDMKDIKPDNKVFLNDYEAYFKEMVQIGRSSRGNPTQMKDKAENSTFAKRIDNKKWVRAVYESDRYVVLQWSNLMAFANWRQKEKEYYKQLAFYEKATGTTTAVAGRGLIDDIDGGPVFYPKQGVCDGRMVSSIWPYELKEYIQEKLSKGEKVSDRLLTLANNLQDEDNPVLIVVTLKE